MSSTVVKFGKEFRGARDGIHRDPVGSGLPPYAGWSIVDPAGEPEPLLLHHKILQVSQGCQICLKFITNNIFSNSKLNSILNFKGFSKKGSPGTYRNHGFTYTRQTFVPHSLPALVHLHERDLHRRHLRHSFLLQDSNV